MVSRDLPVRSRGNYGDYPRYTEGSRGTSHGFLRESHGFQWVPTGPHGDFPGSHGKSHNNVNHPYAPLGLLLRTKQLLVYHRCQELQYSTPADIRYTSGITHINSATSNTIGSLETDAVEENLGGTSVSIEGGKLTAWQIEGSCRLMAKADKGYRFLLGIRCFVLSRCCNAQLRLISTVSALTRYRHCCTIRPVSMLSIPGTYD